MQANELQREWDKTKIALMADPKAVFFASILLSLKHVWDDKESTAYTNGHVLGFNPDFFTKLPKDERVGVTMHEVYHVALDHMGRRLNREMRYWNKAADHVINLDLLARGFKLPSWVLADPRFKDMSTEEVYKILQEEKDTTPAPMEDLREPTDGQGAPIPEEIHQKHIQDVLIRAAVQTKMQGGQPGCIPGEIELFLQNTLRPKLPWQTILRRLVTEMTKQHYTWQRPNRRFYPEYHLPSLYSQGISKLTFYVDISGSVEDFQFSQFVNEIAGVFKMFNMAEVRIVQFDTRIQQDDTVKSISELKKLKFTGRGGTAINPILKHIEETKPQLALVFTDGGFNWPRTDFKRPIVWLINDNPRFVPAFGNVVHFETREK